MQERGKDGVERLITYECFLCVNGAGDPTSACLW